MAGQEESQSFEKGERSRCTKIDITEGRAADTFWDPERVLLLVLSFLGPGNFLTLVFSDQIFRFFFF